MGSGLGFAAGSGDPDRMVLAQARPQRNRQGGCMTARRIAGDLSQLPTAGFGSHSVWYWATIGFMMIEGMGFALALGAYLYLMSRASSWPFHGAPPSIW